MKVQTKNLIGPALDWAVAKCEALTHSDYEPCIPRGNPAHRVGINCDGNSFEPWEPSADWAQGGPIIERERLCVYDYGGDQWGCDDNLNPRSVGPAPLIAAMRCYVASKLGDTVEIPEEICK